MPGGLTLGFAMHLVFCNKRYGRYCGGLA